MFEKKVQENASKDKKASAMTDEDKRHFDASMNHNSKLMIRLARM